MRTPDARVSDLGGWLVDRALDDPDVVPLFAEMCERMVAIGLPVARAMVNWTTLHPLFRLELMVWKRGEGVTFQQVPYQADGKPSEAWLHSPLRHLVESGADVMRRRLRGPARTLDFGVLEEFAAEGLTDWLAIATALHTPSHGGPKEPTGAVTTYATRAPRGFTDRAIGQIRRIDHRFALAVKTTLQGRILRTLASTYLGDLAGGRVLAGQIRHGDGAVIPSVIWYADLRQSTRLISELGQDAYITMLNSYFACTAGAVRQFGGDVLNFIGDAVIAIFPVEAGDRAGAAMRGLAATRESFARLANLNLARAARGEEPLAFGVGLSEGDVMFGNVGIAERLSFSIIGPTVNQTARIEEMTKSLGVPALATAAVARHAPNVWMTVGKHVLRGFSEPAELFAFAG